MMHMEHRLVQTQSQRLMLTQKMQQALQVLQLSGLELEAYVQQELETNPMLEVIPKEPVPVEINAKAESQPEGHDAAQFDDVAFDLDAFASRWDQKLREGQDMSVNRDMADRRDFYENSITREDSFSALLMNQVRMAFDNPKLVEVAEFIIGELDDRGYFTGSLEDIARMTETPLDEVERVLYRVQKFEPTGVGARDATECLLLQINAEYPNEEQLKVLVAEHLDDLQKRQIPKIAKDMGITPERVEDLKELLSTLNPWPGREFSGEPTQYVTPDLEVEKVDDEFVVRLTNERVPDLQINGMYRRMTKDKGMGKDDKVYIRQKLESAKWLIRNIEQRQETILRIGIAIVEVQEDFLRHGVERIKPLTLQEIATKVGVHEATVSRTTRGKYIQTPQGLFELKYFFSPGLKSSNGEDQSSKSVQSVIRKIIDAEDKKKPLSDQKIADMLAKEGLTIARRTVTKYREGMNIPATTMRKGYGA